MHAALEPRRISNDELVYGNLISSCRTAIPFDWLEHRWSLRLSRTLGTSGPRFDVEADWGGARLIVRAPLPWLDLVTAAMLHDDRSTDSRESTDSADAQAVPRISALAVLPELLRLAIIEAAFAKASNRIETATRKRFRIVASGADGVTMQDTEAMEVLGWQCDAGDQQFCGELLVDAQGLAFLATALRAWSGTPGNLDEWAGLPMPLRFAAGWVDLPTRTLADVVPRDVIVLDETWLRALPAARQAGADDAHGRQASYAITVLVGRTSAFQAQLDGSRITVTAGLGDIMADMAQADILEDEGTLDDVTIRLTFDLGERSVTLAELRSLAPGFTFDLGRELRRSVIIRANGVAVGEGELVDIDGRVGVSVLTLNRFSD